MSFQKGHKINLGRKNSQQQIENIREGTKLAMSKPEVKKKISGKNHPMYKEKVLFVCQYCGKTKYITPKQLERKKYCSLLCKYFAGQSVKTRKKIKEHRNHEPDCQCACCKAERGEWKHKPTCQCACCKAHREELFGEKSYSWKGDNIGKYNRHSRVKKLKGKASNYICVGDGANVCNEQAHDWSNVDHKYSLDPDDYLPRCVSCHRKYDFKHNHQHK